MATKANEVGGTSAIAGGLVGLADPGCICLELTEVAQGAPVRGRSDITLLRSGPIPMSEKFTIDSKCLDTDSQPPIKTMTCSSWHFSCSCHMSLLGF
jgi:hypothetical protein